MGMIDKDSLSEKLQWESVNSTSMWAAVPPLWLCYRVTLRTDRTKALRLEWLGNRNDELGTFTDWGLAQAAAQADYEARIRSALLPTIPPSPIYIAIDATGCEYIEEDRDRAVKRAKQLLDGAEERGRLKAIGEAPEFQEQRDAVLEEAAKVADSWQKTALHLGADTRGVSSTQHLLAADMASDIAGSIRSLIKGGK